MNINMLSSLLAIQKLECLKLLTEIKDMDDEPIWEKNNTVEKIIHMIGDPLVSDDKLIEQIRLFEKSNTNNMSINFNKDSKLIFDIAKLTRKGIEEKIVKTIHLVHFEEVVGNLDKLLQNHQISRVKKQELFDRIYQIAQELTPDYISRLDDLAEKYTEELD